MNKRIFYTSLLTLLCIILALSICSCNKNEKEPEGTKEPSPTLSAQATDSLIDFTDSTPLPEEDPTAKPETTVPGEEKVTPSPQESKPTATPEPKPTENPVPAIKELVENAIAQGAQSRKAMYYTMIANGYKEADIETALNQANVDWSAQAPKRVAYLLQRGNYTYSQLIDILQAEMYENSEAQQAVDNCGVDWNQLALVQATEYKNQNPDANYLQYYKYLHDLGFGTSSIKYACAQLGINEP